jgi:hypothetical protein
MAFLMQMNATAMELAANRQQNVTSAPPSFPDVARFEKFCIEFLGAEAIKES